MKGKLTRTLDPTFLNVVANFPGVRENLGGSGELDLAPIVCDPRNFTFVNAFGGVVCVAKAPGLYEIHLISPKGSRAALAMFSLLREVFSFMFCETDALELMALAPAGNPSVERLATLCGFRWFGPREGGEVFTLSLDDWCRRARRPLQEGRAFAATLGVGEPLHIRAIGTTLLLIRTGNSSKALGFYSRLATLLGFSSPQVLTPFPLVINLGGAIFSFRDGSVEVLKCP